MSNTTTAGKGARRPIFAALVATIAITLVISAMPATLANSENNVGRHAYKVNIIGRPNDWSGDDTGSSSNTLFISIKSVAEGEDICEDTSGVTDDTAGGTSYDAVPSGREQIHFQVGEFDVIDRDATDGTAVIQIPANTEGYDIYVRILGGSNKNFHGCLDADAFAQVDSSTYYFAGHLDANRKNGAPEKVKVNDLFDVYVDTDGDGITDTEVSVFDSMFTDYFWQIQNDGLRNMQLIFYEK